jgi:hypothetical protein
MLYIILLAQVCHALSDTGGWWRHSSNQVIHWRINPESLANLNLDPNDAFAEINAAVEEANNHMGSYLMVYGGFSSRTDLSYYTDLCPSSYTGLIVVNNKCSSSLADVGPRCCMVDGMCNGFIMNIYARDPDCSPRIHGKGLPMQPSLAYSLKTIVQHEIGHTMRLADHEETTKSIMYFGVGMGEEKDYFGYDMRCHRDISSKRVLAPKAMVQQADGYFATPTFFGGAAGVLNASVGYTRNSLMRGFDYVASCMASIGYNWLEYLYANTYHHPDTPGPYGYPWKANDGFTAEHIAYYPASNTDYVFFHETVEEGYPDPYFTLWYFSSTDGFVNNRKRHQAYTCERMNTNSWWLSCNTNYPLQPIKTAKKVNTTWNPVVQQMLLAWVNQDRNEYNRNRSNIMISVGRDGVDDSLFSTPDDTGIITGVSPGLTCNHKKCILVYNDRNGRNAVRVQDFFVQYDSTLRRYKVILNGARRLLYIGATTSAPIAAWYNANKFWVAIKSESLENVLQIFYSLDGVSWYVQSPSWSSERSPYWGPSAAGELSERLILF